MSFTATRRRLLMGLAAATTAAVSGAPAAGATRPAETPELVALGDALPPLLDAFTSARAEAERIAAEVAEVWPLAPVEILYFIEGSVMEADVTGTGISRTVEGRRAALGAPEVWRYAPPEALEAMIARERRKIAHVMTTKSKRGLKFHQGCLTQYEAALPVARAYCAEIERLTRESGYPAAAARRTAARGALKAHISAIMRQPAKTMEGVLIQAQALEAWGSVETIFQQVNAEAQIWASAMAGGIMGLATRA